MLRLCTGYDDPIRHFHAQAQAQHSERFCLSTGHPLDIQKDNRTMWIESHQSLRNHPKVKKAARLAGINEFEMIGRLHCLWWWAIDYAPDGDVTKYSAEDIEAAVDWSGIPYAFYNALVDCGFNGHCGLLEKTGDAVLIHDWHKYGGKIIDGREKDAERKRKIRRTSAGHPPDGEETADVDNIREDNIRSQNPYQAALARLEKKFSDLTGIPLPPRETQHDKKSSASAWWNPLGVDIYKNLCAEDEAIALKVIEATIKKMQADNLTISSPRSIVKVAASERGKLNGSTKDQAPRQVYR